jgi:hypothetical protein
MDDQAERDSSAFKACQDAVPALGAFINQVEDSPQFETPDAARSYLSRLCLHAASIRKHLLCANLSRERLVIFGRCEIALLGAVEEFDQLVGKSQQQIELVQDRVGKSKARLESLIHLANELLIESSVRNAARVQATEVFSQPQPGTREFPSSDPVAQTGEVARVFDEGKRFGVRYGGQEAPFPSSARKAFELVKIMLPCLVSKRRVNEIKGLVGSGGVKGQRWASNLCGMANKFMQGLHFTHELSSPRGSEWVAWNKLPE